MSDFETIFVEGDDSADARRSRLESLLDHALEDSFPASDPISLSRPDYLRG